MSLSQANVSRLAALQKKLDVVYAEAVVLTDQFIKAVLAGSIPDERDCADGAYLCKLMSEKVEDLRKEFDKAKQAGARYACEQWASKTLQEVVSGPIRGQLCTATLKVQMIPKIPKRGTEEYIAMCEDLGLNKTCMETFHAHWPSLVQLCTERMAKGQTLPRGIDKALIMTDNGLEFQHDEDFDLAFRKAKD